MSTFIYGMHYYAEICDGLRALYRLMRLLQVKYIRVKDKRDMLMSLADIKCHIYITYGHQRVLTSR